MNDADKPKDQLLAELTALRQRHEQLSRMIQTSPDSILLTRLSDGKILEANDLRKAEEALASQASELAASNRKLAARTIRIASKLDANHVEVTFTDDGVGMDEETVARAVELHDTRAR